MAFKRKIAALALATIMIALAACSGKHPYRYNVAASDDFVMAVATSDRFEVASGKLALKKSKNPKVIKFAKDMIRDHNNSTAMLRQHVAASNMDIRYIPDTMNETQTEKMMELKEASSGRSFDKKYVASQREAHSDAVRLLRSYKKYGQNAELRTFAENTLPKIEHHEQRIYAIEP